jgi:toxin YoeB
MFSGPPLDKWTLIYTNRAQKDAKKIKSSGLAPQVNELLRILEHNPFQTHPPFDKLRGELSGAYSRRINDQHRLIYQVLGELMVVKIIRMWTHYA